MEKKRLKKVLLFSLLSVLCATFVMVYEFNQPGAGWQTGVAITRDVDLRSARWVAVTRPDTLGARSFARLGHANPTLRHGANGWWYLLSTRGTHRTQAEA